MRIRKKKLAIILVVVVLGVIAITPLPMDLDSEDDERAVSHAILALIRDRRVITDKGYQRLEETALLRMKSQVYFQNNLGIPDGVFLKHGLKPIPQGQKIHLGKDNGIIAFSKRNVEGKPTDKIQFVYAFGSLGAHGYEIRIRRSILMRYFIYVDKWVS